MFFFFFNDTATTEIYTLSLHDALPICGPDRCAPGSPCAAPPRPPTLSVRRRLAPPQGRSCLLLWGRWALPRGWRSEEHTSELQSRQYLVCRLLLEKKKKKVQLYNTHLV